MNARMMKIAAVGIAAILLAQAVPAGATEVTIGNDRQARPGLKCDGTTSKSNTYCAAGTQYSNSTNYSYLRALIAFDLTDLLTSGYDPNTSVVNNLTLKMTLLIPTGGGPDNAFTVYGVTQSYGDWDFADDADDLVAAAWNHDSVALGTHTFPSDSKEEGVISVSISGADLTAMLNSWISGENAGLVLVGYEPAAPTKNVYSLYQVGSQELVVDYSAVPEPATMAMLGLGGVMMLVRRRRR